MDTPTLTPITPTTARYIKLGRKDAWAEHCLTHGELHFGHPDEPHELCLSGNWDGAERYLRETLKGPQGVATGSLRELRDFYMLGPDCLWITFFKSTLWWTFAEEEVFDLRDGEGQYGCVMRKARGWQSTSILGQPLRVDRLSTRLTKVAAYQKTICKIEDVDYLLRKINGTTEPTIAKAEAALAETIALAGAMIERLHWRDFETLIGLIFQHSGWRPVSTLGGNMPDADLIVEQRATGERAMVQVKSEADQATLEDYETRATGYDRLFFACHSLRGTLTAADPSRTHLWIGPDLARRAVDAGLLNWLMDACG
ncbi:restriction endonuclease [Microvirga sp. 2YAF29]|uniref:restriction endonuclease n=1 Tax=Microvirga sp. 2YAF29 TaxID=3233031 RepID=UPI003F96F140